MRKKTDQLSFDLGGSSQKQKSKRLAKPVHRQSAKVHSFHEAKVRKSQAEEEQLVRAILTLVTHYK